MPVYGNDARAPALAFGNKLIHAGELCAIDFLYSLSAAAAAAAAAGRGYFIRTERASYDVDFAIGGVLSSL